MLKKLEKGTLFCIAGLRARHHIQLREGLLHVGRAVTRRGDTGNVKKERA